MTQGKEGNLTSELHTSWENAFEQIPMNEKPSSLDQGIAPPFSQTGHLTKLVQILN